MYIFRRKNQPITDKLSCDKEYNLMKILFSQYIQVLHMSFNHYHTIIHISNKNIYQIAYLFVY